MGVWEAMEMLDTLIDESDPDVSSVDPLLCGVDLTRVNHVRRTCHRSSIFCKLPKLYVETESRNGCRSVVCAQYDFNVDIERL